MTDDDMTHEEPTPERARERPATARLPLLPWSIASALAIAAIVLSIWKVNLRGDRDRVQERLATALQDNATLRQQANATAYQLTPTEQGPANASGTAFFSLSGSGVLTVANLPQPEAGKAYQLWYLTGQMNPPIPGGTLVIDAQGIGFMLIPSDVGQFSEIGITAEPEGGSATPTGPMLLTSTVSGARG
jgi:hypothetical protein